MHTLFKRRIRNTFATIIVVALVWLWVRSLNRSLTPSSFTTGYLMLAAVLFLAAYNLRKKLPSLPLGSSTAWLQWHLYVGFGSLAVFAMHAGCKWPTGVLETALAVVYLCTAGSGLLGLYLTRTIPAQLARVGEEVIYERIPLLARQVQRQAGDSVLEAVNASGTTTLADFYTANLYDFFHSRRGVTYFMRPTTALRKALMHDLQSLRRYLSEGELMAYERLFSLVRRKDDLDFHAARQGMLKGWLFVHIGLTYTLVTLAILHGFLALAFRGGAA
jgi:hypothetical protein